MREVSMGPVLNPDGSPTEYTKRFLNDTGRTVEDLLPKQDPLCTDECITATTDDGTITQHHHLCPVLATLAADPFIGIPLCFHGFLAHANDAEYEACNRDYARYLEDTEANDKRADERRGKPEPMKWGDQMPDENGKGGYFCSPCWRQGFGTGFHSYDDPPCDPPSRESRWA